MYFRPGYEPWALPSNAAILLLAFKGQLGMPADQFGSFSRELLPSCSHF